MLLSPFHKNLPPPSRHSGGGGGGAWYAFRRRLIRLLSGVVAPRDLVAAVEKTKNRRTHRESARK